MLAEYVYDAGGRRIGETHGSDESRILLPAGSQVLEETTPTHETMIRYVWSTVVANAMVLRDRDTDDNGSTDERLYVQQDRSRSVTALFDTSGDVVERYAYSPMVRSRFFRQAGRLGREHRTSGKTCTMVGDSTTTLVCILLGLETTAHRLDVGFSRIKASQTRTPLLAIIPNLATLREATSRWRCLWSWLALGGAVIGSFAFGWMWQHPPAFEPPAPPGPLRPEPLVSPRPVVRPEPLISPRPTFGAEPAVLPRPTYGFAGSSFPRPWYIVNGQFNPNQAITQTLIWGQAAGLRVPVPGPCA